MIKYLLATTTLRSMGRNTPSLLRFLAHHSPIRQYQWETLHVLMSDPVCSAWLASLENPTKTRRGFRIHTIINDITSDWIKFHGRHEPSTEKFIMEHLKKGSAFLDIGANLGYFSLLAAYSGQSNVVAFEPQDRIAKLLSKSVDYNRLAGLVRVESIALSDEFGTMKMSSCPGNSGHAQLVNETDPNAQEERVPVMPLDEWVKTNPLGKVSVCKIDTEGAEFKVLCGMKRLLERDAPALVVEIIEEHLVEFKSTTAQILKFLEEKGYSDVSHRYTYQGDHNRYFVKN
jgi:FkbM family methyltransferase